MSDAQDSAAPKRRMGCLGWALTSLALLALILAAALFFLWRAAAPPAPDAFYDAPDEMPREAGVLIRAERFMRAIPEGARAWRILYSTTNREGERALASAIVMAPAREDAEPHPVIAWAHGTTGIAPGCAPSLMPDPFLNVPAIPDALRENWAFVATDYIGLGTAGAHEYLIGEESARAVLDAVRAARAIPVLQLDRRTIVWGHSQGGHSALWAGIRAPEYAPDVPLSGIAALAPATDLPALVYASQGSMFGKIVTSYLAPAYAAAYPDTGAARYIAPSARWLARDIASRCVGGRQTLVSVAETMLLPRAGIFARDPREGAFGARLRENVAGRPIAAPLLIAQGEADDLVLPPIQAGFVAARCAAGQPLESRTYPGRDHISLLAPDSDLAGDLVAWTRARFAGENWAPNCPAPPR